MNFFKSNFWDKNKVSFFSILLFPFALLVSFLNFLRFNLIKTHASQIPIICIPNLKFISHSNE